jgi:hypothetical protein
MQELRKISETTTAGIEIRSDRRDIKASSSHFAFGLD